MVCSTWSRSRTRPTRCSSTACRPVRSCSPCRRTCRPGGTCCTPGSPSGTVRQCPLVVTPPRLELPAEVAAGRGWGLAVQLYSLRSRRSWGVGDLARPGRPGARGAASSSAPTSCWSTRCTRPRRCRRWSRRRTCRSRRRFANPLYLRVEDVPEYAYLPPPRARAVAALAAGRSPPPRASELLDRDAAWEAKRAALRAACTQVPLIAGARRVATRAFRAARGPGAGRLRDLVRARRGARTRLARVARGAARPARRRGRRGARAARRPASSSTGGCSGGSTSSSRGAGGGARDAGMAIGVLHDLAVGVHPEGADAWALQDVLAPRRHASARRRTRTTSRARTGRSRRGDPTRWPTRGYAPYRDMLRAVLRHAGGVRIDHVLGLFRLWWVPRGRAADRGHVRPLRPRGAARDPRPRGAARGRRRGRRGPRHRRAVGAATSCPSAGSWGPRSCGSSATADGDRSPPERWRALCLASVTTHDLPPTAGYLRGEHVRLRERARPAGAAGGRGAGRPTRPSAPPGRTRLRARGLLPTGAERAARPSRRCTGTCGDAGAAARRLAARRRRRPARAEPARHPPAVPELAGAAGRQRGPPGAARGAADAGAGRAGLVRYGDRLRPT